jgi:phospholipase/carboxylesterase
LRQYVLGQWKELIFIAAGPMKREDKGRVYDFEDLEVRSRAMAGFIRAHKEKAKLSHTIGLGYSNGANILAAIVFHNADLFDDIVLMHPLVPWSPADNRALARLRVLITAGRRDPICPPTLTNALGEYFKRQGSTVALEWHEGGHELRPSEQTAIGTLFGAAEG